MKLKFKRRRQELIKVDKTLLSVDPDGFMDRRPMGLRGRATARVAKLKPRGGFSIILHGVLTVLLPFVLYTLVRVEFAQLAIIVVLLSKWRMFSVKARHWPANIRANAVDIIVGISAVLFMTATHSQGLQFVWAVLYGIWLVLVKPKSTTLWIGAQAMIGQLAGLMALYAVYGDSNITILVAGSAAVCYVSARHFFSAFDESMGRTTSYVWAYFAASVAWLLSHWLIFYGVVSQPTLIMSVVGYSLVALYYLHYTDRLTKNVQRQFIAVLTAILLFLIVFSDWSDKTT
jgi:hypothetical protein